MSGFTRCPACGDVMEVERVHNGVTYVWHGHHCGWGQAYMADEDVYPNPEDVPTDAQAEARAGR